MSVSSHWSSHWSEDGNQKIGWQLYPRLDRMLSTPGIGGELRSTVGDDVLMESMVDWGKAGGTTDQLEVDGTTCCGHKRSRKRQRLKCHGTWRASRSADG